MSTPARYSPQGQSRPQRALTAVNKAAPSARSPRRERSGAARPSIPLRVQLAAALLQLGLDPAAAELDHDPALQLRYRDPHTGEYAPAANNPRFLKWRAAFDHDHKTFKDNGSGRSDAGAIAHVKRIGRKSLEHRQKMQTKVTGEPASAPARRKRKIASRPFAKGHRPLRNPKLRARP